VLIDEKLVKRYHMRKNHHVLCDFLCGNILESAVEKKRSFQDKILDHCATANMVSNYVYHDPLFFVAEGLYFE
jgi:hypothetical protein